MTILIGNNVSNATHANLYKDRIHPFQFSGFSDVINTGDAALFTLELTYATPEANVIAVIYSNDLSTIYWESSPTAVVAGVNEIVISPTVSIGAGPYALALMFSEDVQITKNSAGTNTGVDWYPAPFAGGAPLSPSGSSWITFGGSPTLWIESATPTGPTITGPDTTTEGAVTVQTGTLLDTVVTQSLVSGSYSIQQTIDSATATTLNYVAESGVNQCTPSTPVAGVPLEPTITAAGITPYVVQQESKT